MTDKAELTFEQQQEISQLLEQYSKRPSNSNKIRYQLFGYIDQHTEKRVAEARIDELKYYPLNWALNRNDEVWEKMIRSRLDELNKQTGDSDE